MGKVELQKLVAAGRITQQEADELLAHGQRMDQKIDRIAKDEFHAMCRSFKSRKRAA